MEPERRTLVVANRTAATALLLEEIERRAEQRLTAFVLLIPENPADWTLDEALKAIRRAAAGATGQRVGHVEGRVSEGDAFESVRDVLAGEHFDDVIISTLSKRTSKWLRRDLPRQVQQLGVPVTVITPETDPRMGLKDLPVMPGPG
jgi:hypothetical protein